MAQSKSIGSQTISEVVSFQEKKPNSKSEVTSWPKEEEKSLLNLQQQNQLILNAAGEGIFGLDLEGRHTFVNPAAARMLGYTIEELLGTPSHITWHHTRADGRPYPAEECPIYGAYKDGLGPPGG